MESQEKTYLVTRPKLREKLEQMGFECKEVKNPYSDYLKAWVFPLTRPLAIFVVAYYAQMGKEAPMPIAEFLRNEGA